MTSFIAGKRGIILDMDGVLFLSAPIHARAYQEALAEVGIHDVDYRSLAGLATENAVGRELERHGHPATPDRVARITARKRRLAHQYLAASPPVVHGCRQAISDLRLHAKLGLASSASKANVRLFLEASRTEPFFDVVLDCGDVAAAKPAPDLFLAAMKRLGTSPAETLVVEDAASGIEAARRAGIDVVAVTGTLERQALERESGVIGVVDRLEQIRPRSHNVLTLDEAESAGVAVHPHRWTAIVPAAGAGSRLGYALPKILYPVLGRPILDWLIDLLEPVCGRFVFVLSPAGRPHVEPQLRTRLGSRASIVIQPEPTGMGDAVRMAESATSTPYCCVVWGDQVLLKPTTVRACLGVQEARSDAVAALPTVVKPRPYIHLARDADDRIVAVQQARENEIHTPVGENDCGLFAFRREPLFAALREAKEQAAGIGTLTREFNLLPVLPRLQQGWGPIVTVRIEDEVEALGINTYSEAEAAGSVLCR